MQVAICIVFVQSQQKPTEAFAEMHHLQLYGLYRPIISSISGVPQPDPRGATQCRTLVFIYGRRVAVSHSRIPTAVTIVNDVLRQRFC